MIEMNFIFHKLVIILTKGRDLQAEGQVTFISG